MKNKIVNQIVNWMYVNDGKFPSKHIWRSAFIEFLRKLNIEDNKEKPEEASFNIYKIGEDKTLSEIRLKDLFEPKIKKVYIPYGNSLLDYFNKNKDNREEKCKLNGSYLRMTNDFLKDFGKYPVVTKENVGKIFKLERGNCFGFRVIELYRLEYIGENAIFTELITGKKITFVNKMLDKFELFEEESYEKRKGKEEYIRRMMGLKY